MALFYYAILDTTNIIIDTIMAQRFEFLTLLWHSGAMAQPGRGTVSLIRGTVAGQRHCVANPWHCGRAEALCR